MNMQTGKLTRALDLAECAHWSNELPYRAIIAVGEQQPHGTILYQVAGSAETACGAARALKTALKIHNSKCFYCNKEAATETSEHFTLDHVEALASGGTNDLSNLVVACRPCNVAKGQSSIDAFNPRATEEWLYALRDQIDKRLAKLGKANSESM